MRRVRNLRNHFTLARVRIRSGVDSQRCSPKDKSRHRPQDRRNLPLRLRCRHIVRCGDRQAGLIKPCEVPDVDVPGQRNPAGPWLRRPRDRQNLADRLDPVRRTMIVDEGD